MRIINWLPSGIQEFIERHPKFKIAFLGFGYLFSERIFKIITGFFVHALLARHLGPEYFGKLSYVVRTVSIFFAFGTFGVDEIVIRYLMENTYAKEDVIKTVLRVRLFMSLIGFICLGVFVLIFRPEGFAFSLMTFLFGVLIFFQAFGVYELDFHSRMDFKPIFWANNFGYLAAAVLRVVGVFTGATISFFLFTYLVGESVLRGLVIKVFGLKKALKGNYQKNLARMLTLESIPFFISAFIVLLDQRLSFIFLEKRGAFVELGNYSVAVTLVDIWIFLPTAVCSAVYPTIITAFRGERRLFELRIQYLTDVVVWLAFIFIGAVFFTSEKVISVLYGDRYLQAPQTLILFSLTTIPVFFNLARIKWLILENRLRDWLSISAVCLILNLVGHIYFVPIFGIPGAIGSFLGAQIIGNLIMTIFLESSRRSFFIFMRSVVFPFRLLKVLR